MDELTPLLKRLCQQHGFMADSDIANLAELDRLRSVDGFSVSSDNDPGL